MAHAQNMTSIGDGRIKLYQRDDVKNAVWQCRIKMKGYRVPIRRTTEETDFERAKERVLIAI